MQSAVIWGTASPMPEIGVEQVIQIRAGDAFADLAGVRPRRRHRRHRRPDKRPAQEGLNAAASSSTMQKEDPDTVVHIGLEPNEEDTRDSNSDYSHHPIGDELPPNLKLPPASEATYGTDQSVTVSITTDVPQASFSAAARAAELNAARTQALLNNRLSDASFTKAKELTGEMPKRASLAKPRQTWKKLNLSEVTEPDTYLHVAESMSERAASEPGDEIESGRTFPYHYPHEVRNTQDGLPQKLNSTGFALQPRDLSLNPPRQPMVQNPPENGFQFHNFSTSDDPGFQYGTPEHPWLGEPTQQFGESTFISEPLPTLKLDSRELMYEDAFAGPHCHLNNSNYSPYSPPEQSSPWDSAPMEAFYPGAHYARSTGGGEAMLRTKRTLMAQAPTPPGIYNPNELRARPPQYYPSVRGTNNGPADGDPLSHRQRYSDYDPNGSIATPSHMENPQRHSQLLSHSSRFQNPISASTGSFREQNLSAVGPKQDFGYPGRPFGAPSMNTTPTNYPEADPRNWPKPNQERLENASLGFMFGPFADYALLKNNSSALPFDQSEHLSKLDIAGVLKIARDGLDSVKAEKALRGESMPLDECRASAPNDDYAAVSAKYEEANCNVANIMIPALLHLSSYICGHQNYTVGHFNRMTSRPRWAIDHGPDGNKSFFEEDWGTPPKRLGRDPRYSHLRSFAAGREW